jgi:hypothetical protein
MQDSELDAGAEGGPVPVPFCSILVPWAAGDVDQVVRIKDPILSTPRPVRLEK